MGFIKEPKGVDFAIQSERLTDKDRKEISEFIKNYKQSQIKKTSTNSNRTRSKNTRVKS